MSRSLISRLRDRRPNLGPVKSWSFGGHQEKGAGTLKLSMRTLTILLSTEVLGGPTDSTAFRQFQRITECILYNLT